MCVFCPFLPFSLYFTLFFYNLFLLFPSVAFTILEQGTKRSYFPNFFYMFYFLNRRIIDNYTTVVTYYLFNLFMFGFPSVVGAILGK